MVPMARPMPPAMIEQEAKAQKLVKLSQRLGWGGIAMLTVGTTIAALTIGAPAAVVVGVASGASVLAGAIVGQVGRGMQGRAI